MRRISRTLFMVVLLGAQAAAVVTLERLGRVPGYALPRHGTGQWVLHASTEDLFAVAARLLGLGLAWWLLAGTILSLARRVVPGGRRVRALDLLTPAALRHTLDRVLALGLGASLGLASIHPAGAVTRPAPGRRDTPVVRSPAPLATPTPATPTPAPPRSAPGPLVVVVRAGDNLWVIARRALQTAGRASDADAIAPYWRRVVAANATTLRSRDPNLIFPGERVVLPPIGKPPG